jgi:chloramphenicol-sensitive protein RarD
VGSNWLGFLWAVDQRLVIAGSLGYFLTPLVNVLLGMLVLKERLNGKEWAAVGLAVAAVGNEFVALGSLPWVSLFLGGTFGLYGLVRKQVPVDAVSGLWLETLSMLPLACTPCGRQPGARVFTGHDGLTDFLLAMSG